ncbi:MAG: WD40 repeat domain-containing protein, partial [Gemmataceae bacterium]
DRPVFGEVNKLLGETDTSKINSFCVKNDKVLSVKHSGKAEFWDLASTKGTGKKLATEKYTTGILNKDGGLAFLATAKTNEIVAWNTISDALSFKLEGHPENEIISLFLMEDKNLLVSADLSGKVSLWDLQLKKNIKNLNIKKHLGFFISLFKNDLVFANDADYLLVRNGRTCLFWNIKEDKIAAEIIIGEGNTGERITHIKISPDSKYLILGLAKGSIQIWSLEKGVKEKNLVGHNSDIEDIVFLNANFFASASRDREIRIWNIQNERTEWGYSVADEYANNFYTSPEFIQVDLKRNSLWAAGSVIRELKLPDFLKTTNVGVSENSYQPLVYSALLAKKEAEPISNSLKQLEEKSDKITSNSTATFGNGETEES